MTTKWTPIEHDKDFHVIVEYRGGMKDLTGYYNVKADSMESALTTAKRYVEKEASPPMAIISICVVNAYWEADFKRRLGMKKKGKEK